MIRLGRIPRCVVRLLRWREGGYLVLWARHPRGVGGFYMPIFPWGLN